MLFFSLAAVCFVAGEKWLQIEDEIIDSPSTTQTPISDPCWRVVQTTYTTRFIFHRQCRYQTLKLVSVHSIAKTPFRMSFEFEEGGEVANVLVCVTSKQTVFNFDAQHSAGVVNFTLVPELKTRFLNAQEETVECTRNTVPGETRMVQSDRPMAVTLNSKNLETPTIVVRDDTPPAMIFFDQNQTKTTTLTISFEGVPASSRYLMTFNHTLQINFMVLVDDLYVPGWRFLSHLASGCYDDLSCLERFFLASTNQPITDGSFCVQTTPNDPLSWNWPDCRYLSPQLLFHPRGDVLLDEHVLHWGRIDFDASTTIRTTIQQPIVASIFVADWPASQDITVFIDAELSTPHINFLYNHPTLFIAKIHDMVALYSSTKTLNTSQPLFFAGTPTGEVSFALVSICKTRIVYFENNGPQDCMCVFHNDAFDSNDCEYFTPYAPDNTLTLRIASDYRRAERKIFLTITTNGAPTVNGPLTATFCDFDRQTVTFENVLECGELVGVPERVEVRNAVSFEKVALDESAAINTPPFVLADGGTLAVDTLTTAKQGCVPFVWFSGDGTFTFQTPADIAVFQGDVFFSLHASDPLCRQRDELAACFTTPTACNAFLSIHRSATESTTIVEGLKADGTSVTIETLRLAGAFALVGNGVTVVSLHPSTSSQPSTVSGDITINKLSASRSTINEFKFEKCQDSVMAVAGNVLFDTPCTMRLRPERGVIHFSSDSLIVDVDEGVSFSVLHDNVAATITRTSLTPTKAVSPLRVSLTGGDGSLVIVGDRMTVDDSLDIGSGWCDGLTTH